MIDFDTLVLADTAGVATSQVIIFVANFGVPAFTYGVPSGFTAGWPS